MVQVAVFYFVYKIVLKIDTPNYLAFIVTGLIPWVFFSATINESFDTLSSSHYLLTQIPIPIQTFPAASAFTNFANLLLSLPAIAAVLLFGDSTLSAIALMFFPLTALLFVFTYSLAFIFAASYVAFRDVKHIFGIAIQLWLYLTPVLYSPSQVPSGYHWMLLLNPLAPYFIAVRDVLIFDRLPEQSDILMLFAWTTVALFIANTLRIKIGPRLVERL